MENRVVTVNAADVNTNNRHNNISITTLWNAVGDAFGRVCLPVCACVSVCPVRAVALKALA